ncbi:MAG: GAF domain-containing protein, partial [Flammeovirgaceae bacterium]
VRESDQSIAYLSENTMKVFGLPHQDLLGKPLATLFSSEDYQLIKANLGSQNFKMVNPIQVKVNGRAVDLILHRRNGVLFIEVEKSQPNENALTIYQEKSQKAIVRILGAQTVPELIQAAVDEIREITNYDRVLFYVFDEQYHGKVIGESRVPDINSFLGSRFPAWETPGKVRELYRTNFTRYMPHVFDVPVKIAAADGSNTEGSLDMTNTILRATRQCHIQYLTNMGVGASLTFSMTMNGRLWGFIVCHKRKPGELSYTHRLICEQVAGVIPDELWSREQPELYESRLIGLKDQVVANVQQAPNVASGILGKHKEVLELARASGAALYYNNILKVFGQGPTDDEVRTLIQHLVNDTYNLVFQEDSKGLIYTNNLVSYFDKMGLSAQTGFARQIKEKASGLVIIPITPTGKDFLLWFRPEQVTVATWAGNPSKNTIFDEKYIHAPLNPRKSFESWKANVVNRSEAWLPMEVGTAKKLRDALIG